MTQRIVGSCLLLVSLVVVRPVGAQDPWAKVPVFPKACYTKGEPFLESLQKAIEDGEAAVSTQQETNQAAKAKLDEIDIMTKQSRMSDFLRKNPAAAGQMMQEIAASGTKTQEAVREKAKASEAIEARWKAVETQSRADQGVYLNFLTQARVAFEPANRSAGKGPGLLGQYNEAYKKYCQKWFVEPTSPFLGYLAEYKRHLIDKDVALDDQVAKGETAHFQVYGVPLEGYQSTGTLEAVVKYLKAADQIYRSREEEPRTSP